MKLLELKYDYLNKYIKSEELVIELEKLNFKKYSENECQELKSMIEEIKNIHETTPNEIDEDEKKRLEDINNLLKAFERSFNPRKKMDKDLKEFIMGRIEELKFEKEQVRDCGKLYDKISLILLNCQVMDKIEKNLSDKSFLDFVTSKSYSFKVPIIDQEKFDRVLELAFGKRQKNQLCQLIINFDSLRNISFDNAFTYLILKRDAENLIKILTSLERQIDYNEMIDRIVKTQDVNFVRKFQNRILAYDLLSREQMDRLQGIIKKMLMQ